MRRPTTLLILYVGALFLSLPLTPYLVDGLKTRGLLGEVVAAIFLVSAGLSAFGLWFKLRLRSTQFYGILALLLMVLAAIVWNVKTHQEQVHFLEYGLLALLTGRVVRSPAWAFGWAATVGVCDEAVQFLLPMRYFDLRDIAFNATAAGFGAAVLWLIQRFAPDFHGD